MLSIRSIGKGTLCLPLCVLALGCSHQQTPAGPVPSSETLIPQVDAQALKDNRRLRYRAGWLWR